MAKIKEMTYCSFCGRDVIMEYEDIEARQYTLCPICGAEHYRQLPENVRLIIRQMMASGVAYGPKGLH